jgi:hypothetical protein
MVVFSKDFFLIKLFLISEVDHLSVFKMKFGPLIGDGYAVYEAIVINIFHEGDYLVTKFI